MLHNSGHSRAPERLKEDILTVAKGRQRTCPGPCLILTDTGRSRWDFLSLTQVKTALTNKVTYTDFWYLLVSSEEPENKKIESVANALPSLGLS